MMYAQDKQHVPDRVELKGILSEFRDALEEEIDKIKKSGQSSTLLFGGRQIESHGADLWYRFNVEYVPSLPADTPCKLVIGKDQFDVTVISYEENSIVISTKTTLPDTIGKARLENGATVLMERLIKCIEENAEKENPAGKRMLSSDCGVYPVKKIFEYDDLALNTGNTQSQNNAIVSALSSDITYIWGPPGTGKTTVIGQIIDELYKHDRSVLVVSHTNTAVDGAIEKADKTYSKSNQDNDTNYPILRIGTPARPLPDRVLLAQHVAALGKELYEQKAALEKQQAELQHHINEIRPLLAKDVWLKESNLDVIRKALQSIVAKGKWTIDPKWDNKYNQGRYWTEEELWGAIDKDGNEVIPFIFDEIKHFFDRSDMFMVHYGGWKDGHWGVVDCKGNWLAEPTFEGFSYETWKDRILFYAEDPDATGDGLPMGIYDLAQKKVLFEPQFLDVTFRDNGDMEVEVFDEELGRTIEKIIDPSGKERFKSIYSSIYTWHDLYEVVIRDKDGARHGLIDKEGNEILPCIYDVPWNGFYHEQQRICFVENGKQGMKDYDGNIIIPAIYHEIHGRKDPYLTVRVGEKDSYKEGLITYDGKTVIEANHSRIGWCSDHKHFFCCADGRCEMYVVEDCA